MEERFDSLDKDYKKISRLEILITILFWLSAILSISVLFMGFNASLKTVLTISYIIIVSVYFFASQFCRLYLMPNTEEKRIKQFLSDSFNVPLITEKTNKYYNTDEVVPSIKKLGLNTLENSLFSKKVCQRMANKQRIITFSYILIWLGCLVYRNTDLELLAVIAQTIFSSELLIKYIKLELLRHNNERVYDNLYNLFLIKEAELSGTSITKIMFNVIKYESIKAFAGIKQSSRIFFKINDKVSKEWETIKKNLGVSKT